MVDRRDFLRTGMSAMVGSALFRGQRIWVLAPVRRITIHSQLPPSDKARLAVQELVSGLRALGSAPDIVVTSEAGHAPDDVHLVLAIDAARLTNPEAYDIAATDRGVILTGANEQAVLYAVFDFLERQGMVFGLEGPSVPLDRAASLSLPVSGTPWTATPQFAVRGLLPWPDFLNCISVYNPDDFQAYFANMLRMRLNMFGMHVYPDEAYLSYSYAGVGHRAWLETSAINTWGYTPQRTSTYKMGAAEFFDRETFGADADRFAGDVWDAATLTTKMLREAFSYAARLGIRTGIGFEPYSYAPEIEQALPPQAAQHPGGLAESPIGRDLIERRLADLLERYPMVHDVWLWEDEDVSWNSRKQNLPAPTAYYTVAHDFLQRHAPEKRMVLAGWGGVARNFLELHEKLPGDIIFSALNDTLGWDPVSDNFGMLEGRERWPIPWLEDDPSMWFPQFRASKVERDMHRAKELGCQGMLGIHWRHRIVGPTMTYFARAAWDAGLTASNHYRAYSAAQAAGERVDRLSALFHACDQDRKVVSTSTGNVGGDGFSGWISPAPDYAQGFRVQKINPILLDAQRTVAQQFAALSHDAAPGTERDRLDYLGGYVGFMVPYCDALTAAAELKGVLADASTLRAGGREDDAKACVAKNGVPLWLQLAPLVREVMLTYQSVVSERNEQGQLASMQNKLVRIALEQMRLSLKEFLGELPSEVDNAYAAAIAPDPAPLRVFIPTRPGIVQAKEEVRVRVIVPGGGPQCEVHAYVRSVGSSHWTVCQGACVGRSVYRVDLGWFSSQDGPVEYYASVKLPGQAGTLVAPLGGGDNPYRFTVV